MDFAQSMAETFAPKTAHPASRYLDAVLVWGLRVLTLLLPLTFLPWTFEAFELNKQFLLLGGGVALLAVWVGSVVLAREVRWVRSVLNWAVLAFLAVVVVSTVFSIDKVTSILGFYGRFNGGLVSVIAYVVYYFLVLHVVRREGNVRWLVGSWLTGVGVAALVLALNLFGVHALGFFPLGQASSFTPLGSSLNALTLILGASFPLALFFAHSARTTVGRMFSLLFSVLVLAVVFLVDYQLGWVALLTASVVWLGFVFWKNETVGFQWTILPAVALLLVVVGWPVVTTQLTRRSIPVEVNLSLPASWKIANQNIKANPLIGTGPETFIFGFSKYKPDQFNQSDFWAYRFDKSASELSQAFGTMGILGLASYLGILLLGLYLAWRTISHRAHEDWYLRAAVVTSYLVLAVGSVLYFSNTALAFMFWLVLALLAGFSSAGNRELTLKGSPRISFLFSFGLAVVVLLAAGVWVGIVRFWSADYAYAKAQGAAQLEQAQGELQTAVSLNPWRDTYRVGLAQVYLGLANQQARQPAGDTDAKRKAQLAQLQQYISSAIAAARSATDLSRENVFNWESLGSIYRGTVPYARDAQAWVISSFQEAIKLEYSNPALHTELGKAYLLSASQSKAQASTTTDQAAKAKLDSDTATNLGLAIEQFKVAIQLKAQYTPAHFNEALAYELQGKIDDAIAKLESIRSFNATDVDVLYELGSLYYSKGNYDLALSAFSTITSLVPNHSNAHYGLSLVYQKKGDKDKAVAEMQKVLDLNPGNQQIQQQLDALKTGAAPAAPTTPTTPKQ